MEELVTTLSNLLTTLVRGKTGSEEGQHKEPYVNAGSWSKRMFDIIISDGIPQKLHIDEELLLSIVLKLFCISL
jgi:hypothetical protein